MLKNRHVFTQDPVEATLLNHGVAAVAGVADDPRILQYELQTFVCEGEYAKGLIMILESYLGNVDRPDQPAAWVSGFYGSGKSHLVKMLQYLWTDCTFPNKSTARGIVRLPDEIRTLLTELSTKGRQNRGLHAAAGTLGTGSSVPLAVLSILYSSLGLPAEYPAARFVLWLKKKGMLEKVTQHLAKAKTTLEAELRDMYVSTPLAEAVLKADPKLADSPAAALTLIEQQFQSRDDIRVDEMVACIRDALVVDGTMPCTALILDEVQQFIGDDNTKSYAVQEATEALSKRFGGKIMVIGTGQATLTSTPQLARLKDRFTRNIHLSDTDVETVIRKVVLEKKPDKADAVKEVIESCQGEIARHLVGTRIEPKLEDDRFLVADYPLLPVRQRFWERIIRAVDSVGRSGQLRTQLRISHEAAQALAEAPLGTVVPADFIFDQIATEMLQTGMLPRELHNVISELLGGNGDDKLCGRLCATIFLIGKLPRDGSDDLGVRANANTLADLLVSDLTAGSTDLRKRIPEMLDRLVENGRLLRIEEEYRLQTAESTQWELEYQQNRAKVMADEARIAHERVDLFQREISGRIGDIKLLQGQSKVARKLNLGFGETPPVADQAIPVWVRNGWDDSEANVMADARAAGVDSPLITVFIPKRAPEDLKRLIANGKAAEDTLNHRGNPTTVTGQEARDAMQSRFNLAKGNIEVLFNHDILGGTQVILAGGQEFHGLDLAAKVKDAAEGALVRLFPEFDAADHKDWDKVLERAKQGAANALEAVGHKGNIEQHPVCAAILSFVGAGKRGNEIRRHFEESPYGWSREAINAALVVLVGAGQLRAAQNGRALERGQLNQTNIGVTDFRVESTTVTAAQRIALRSLYQAAGIACASNEESAKAGEFLNRMIGLAESAGGTSPLPARPDTTHVSDLANLAGNEQLVGLFDARDRLADEAKQWKAAAEKVARRLPRWQLLESLMTHAQGMPVADEVTPQMNAVTRNRTLLADPDPVPGLCDKVTAALRAELVRVHGECQRRYDTEWKKLGDSEVWQKISADDRPIIARDAQIKDLPDIAVGTDEDLLTSLNTRPLEGWRTLRDALPARFQNAATLAAQLLQPKAVRVSLPSATITTPAELDAWLATARDTIASKLAEGPVIV